MSHDYKKLVVLVTARCLPFSVTMTSVWPLPYLAMCSTASSMLATSSTAHSRPLYSILRLLAGGGPKVRRSDSLGPAYTVTCAERNQRVTQLQTRVYRRVRARRRQTTERSSRTLAGIAGMVFGEQMGTGMHGVGYEIQRSNDEESGKVPVPGGNILPPLLVAHLSDIWRNNEISI